METTIVNIDYYTPEIFDFLENRVLKIIDNANCVDDWVANLTEKKLDFWNNVANLTIKSNDNKKVLEEQVIFCTITIKLFLLELDIETANLKESYIKELIGRLNLILKFEIAVRKKVFNKKRKYTLVTKLEAYDMMD